MDTGSVLLLIPCILLLLLFIGFCVWSLFCNAVLNVISGFAINMLRKESVLLSFVFSLPCYC